MQSEAGDIVGNVERFRHLPHFDRKAELGQVINEQTELAGRDEPRCDLPSDRLLVTSNDRSPAGWHPWPIAAAATLIVDELVRQSGTALAAAEPRVDDDGSPVTVGPVDGPVEQVGQPLESEHDVRPAAQFLPRLPTFPTHANGTYRQGVTITIV